MSDAYNHDTGSTGEEAERELAEGKAPARKVKKKPAAPKSNEPKKPAAPKKPKKKPDPAEFEDSVDTVSDAARGQLRSFVQRIERLDEERSEIAADMKEVYAEAKAMGFDTKVLRKVISARKQDRQEREKQQSLFDMYWDAVEGYIERSDSDERGE